MDATEQAAAIREGRQSSVEAVTASLAAIDARNGELNAFTIVTAEAALARAASVDAGAITGPLAGVPISVKDHVWVEGLPATNGSRALESFVAPETCAAVQRLLDAGAIIVGKTNNPEFCYRGVTANDLHGVTRNPHDPTRTTGGSSGGAAASVAAAMVPLAVGTDGGGSIRIPSAFCGTYGLKPTFGLIPKLPGFRGWPTLSVTGPIAGSARDLALAVSVMAGPSGADYLSYPGPPVDYLGGLDRGWSGLRVAVSEDLGFAEVDPDVRAAFRAALDAISDAGARVVERHPAPVDPSPLWDSIALPEGYASEGPLVTAHPDLVGVDAAQIALAGRSISATAYLDAQDARARYAQQWEAFFEGGAFEGGAFEGGAFEGGAFDHVDVLLTPAMPVTAFEIGRLAPATIDGRPVPESFDAWCALALPANLAGLPAACVPIGTGRDDLPVGLQVLGRRWSDDVVLRAAAAIIARR